MKDNCKILDVGCGERPRGDVNLDIAERDVENFVLGDATELPFDDKSFATVYSSGLSLWTKESSEDELLKSWQEAIRVAKIQIISEFNFTPHSKTWHLPHPLVALNWCQDNISKTITLEYSERGKIAKPIRIFETFFGSKVTIFVLNKIFRKSYCAKLKYYLSDERSYPEVKI